MNGSGKLVHAAIVQAASPTLEEGEKGDHFSLLSISLILTNFLPFSLSLSLSLSPNPPLLYSASLHCLSLLPTCALLSPSHPRAVPKMIILPTRGSIGSLARIVPRGVSASFTSRASISLSSTTASVMLS